MKQIAIWYFNYGWLIMMFLGFWMGFYCANRNKWILLINWTVFVILLGGTMFYFKWYY